MEKIMKDSMKRTMTYKGPDRKSEEKVGPVNRIFTKNTSGEQGFTLTELMVVVAIMMITAAIALPMYIADIPRQKAKAAAAGLQSDLRFARSRAVADRTPVLLCFNDGGGSHSYAIGLEVDDDAADCMAKNIKEVPFSNLHQGVVFGKGNTSQVCPESTGPAGPVLFAGKVARFSIRGTSVDAANLIQTSSVVYLTHLKDPDRANYCIQVEGTTGRARLYRWEGGTWK